MADDRPDRVPDLSRGNLQGIPYLLGRVEDIAPGPVPVPRYEIETYANQPDDNIPDDLDLSVHRRPGDLGRGNDDVPDTLPDVLDYVEDNLELVPGRL